MEDILASIKRIIAEDGAAVVPPRIQPLTPAGAPAALHPVADIVSRSTQDDVSPPFPEPCEILELTEPAPPLVSPDTTTASRQSLASLSALMVRTPASAAGATADNTLEGLMRDLLRPMLKEWLDARLPEIVESMVSVEIARITGKN